MSTQIINPLVEQAKFQEIPNKFKKLGGEKSVNRTIEEAIDSGNNYIIAADLTASNNKIYKIINSYQEYVEYLQHAGNQNMYEFFTRTTPVKMYIDFDKKDCEESEHDHYYSKMLEVIDYIRTCMNNEFVDEEPTTNAEPVITSVAIQSSCGYTTDKNGKLTYKFSYHVIFNGLSFKNCSHAAAYLFTYLSKAPDHFKEYITSGFFDQKNYPHFDTNVYNQRCFRSVKQTKRGDTRVLQLDPVLTNFVDNIIVCEHGEEHMEFESDIPISVYIKSLTVKEDITRKRKLSDAEDTKSERGIGNGDERYEAVNDWNRTFVYNEEQHDLIIDMFKKLNASATNGEETKFFTIYSMCKSCEFTYEEWNEHINQPYLQWCREHKGRESQRADKVQYTEYGYNSHVSDRVYTYKSIALYLRKHFKLEIPRNFDQHASAITQWYFDTKEEFEENVFRESMNTFIIIRDIFTKSLCHRRVKTNELHECCQSLYKYFDKKLYEFTKFWVRDHSVKIINYFDWQPLPLRTNEPLLQVQTIIDPLSGDVRTKYNSWSGFYYNRCKPQHTERNQRIFELWCRVINNICGDPTTEVFQQNQKFIHEYIASMIQYPNELKSVANAIMSTKKGIGKDFIGKMIAALLLADEEKGCERVSYAHHVNGDEAATSKGVFGDFNANLQNKLFVHIEEYKKEVIPIETMRAAITSTTINIQKKGIDAVTQKNYASFFITGQDPDFDLMDNEDRRFQLYAVKATTIDSNEILPWFHNMNIWGALQNHFIKDASFCCYLFHYYANLPIDSNINWKDRIVNTNDRLAITCQPNKYSAFVLYLYDQMTDYIENKKNGFFLNGELGRANVGYIEENNRIKFVIDVGDLNPIFDAYISRDPVLANSRKRPFAPKVSNICTGIEDLFSTAIGLTAAAAEILPHCADPRIRKFVTLSKAKGFTTHCENLRLNNVLIFDYKALDNAITNKFPWVMHKNNNDS
jgi:hypothetical protein